MYEIKRDGKKIILKEPASFVEMEIVSLASVCMVVHLIVKLLPPEDGYTVTGLLGAGILYCWMFFAVIGVVYAFGMLGKRVILDDTGVKCRFFFRETRFAWSEIRDYGLSYCGQTRWEGSTYYFYFSGTPLQAKNAYRKKLKGKIIKLYAVGDRSEEILYLVLPFCQKKTGIDPFPAQYFIHIP